MKNTGTLFANEVNAARAKALVGNCHRMGIVNTIVCVEDGRVFPKIMKNFDRVLLDAPCSGTGIIAKDPSVKASKTNEDIMRCTVLQKELVLAAIDACKVGGYIVYSTCSILAMYKEQHVEFLLDKEDTITHYLNLGEKKAIQFDKEQKDALDAALAELPHAVAISVAAGVNNLKKALSEFFRRKLEDNRVSADVSLHYYFPPCYLLFMMTICLESDTEIRVW
ncbi:unnamed protein product [Echinostoma caproni]|uniref:SAM_MT_RSMB_NOP domain-containing protein n=1 Tax=Echinostoma caproni TaxID=27848 RepID=A0A182ZZT1_9TREM|nr:unnamed protein product [Echinostoma caproni]